MLIILLLLLQFYHHSISYLYNNYIRNIFHQEKY